MVYKRKLELAKVAALSVSSLIFVMPIIFMLNKSLGKNGLLNYAIVLQKTNMARNFANSSIVAASTIVLVVITVSLAAYAFSKMYFPLKNAFYLLFLTGLMIPGASILFPTFLTIKKFGLIDNFIGLIGPYVATQIPFNLVIMKNYYDTVPNDLIEAARIDGCGSLRILVSVIAPISAPALSVVIIWVFIGCWNEFMYAFVFINRPEMRTLTALPLKFISQFSTSYELVFATLTLIEIPVIILYLFTQQKLQEGITAGAVKG